jgi:hypothetical protein
MDDPQVSLETYPVYAKATQVINCHYCKMHSHRTTNAQAQRAAVQRGIQEAGEKHRHGQTVGGWYTGLSPLKK